MVPLPADFSFRWTISTFAGWALGFVLVLVLIGGASGVGLGETQFPLGLGMGIGVGLIQGRRLAPFIGSGEPWLFASATALTVPLLLSDLAGLVGVERAYSLPILIVAGGILAGLLQWRILRRFSPVAAWWILAATAGWSLGATTVVFNDHYLPRVPGIVGALMYVSVLLIGGVLLGIVTAPVLRQILRRPWPNGV